MKSLEHCRGCLSFVNHGNKILTEQQKKYNNWCCAKGAPAEKSIGWCKTHGKKRAVVNE